jgi:predicted DCC family thiol-disulfide oxidoreductase YuxK
VLIFDGDCAFCSSAVRWLQRGDPELHAVPWQHADIAALGLSHRDVARSAWWIDTRGRRHGGAAAAGMALRGRGGVWRVVARLSLSAPFSWMAAVVYRLIAANRHHLPGGTPACALPPRDRP